MAIADSNILSTLSCNNFVELTSIQISITSCISNQTLAGLLPGKDTGCALVSKV
jgi:hypothetical protein